MARFALIADPHVTVPNPDTGWRPPVIETEPTMYVESVELLEAALDAINADSDLDFILVAGDLTKDSEPYNHDKARELLSRFRRPVFCVPGNHDQPRPAKLRPPHYLDPAVRGLTVHDFPRCYGDFGFDSPTRLAYSANPTPDVHLIGLCSPAPEYDYGEIPSDVLAWLDDDLGRERGSGREPIVMLHHSIIDHVPGESMSELFSWFHVRNATALKTILHRHGVRITLSGHLHIQDVKAETGLHNIVTSSLAGYPHAYRTFDLRPGEIRIASHRLQTIPSRPDLQAASRAESAESFVGVLRSVFMARPYEFAPGRAAEVAERLRDWWPTIAEGNEQFAYTAEELGDAALAAYVNSFSDRPPPDNDLTIELPRRA
ncbi:MAG: metallophosphoesterase [Deltaproteobacteria bacterium]|nr:metallophosphoesterase [Deltaproteobacteria bacterium]MBI3387253.1 metallophosphoesterase [Deltaproteobacteria bacterium]